MAEVKQSQNEQDENSDIDYQGYLEQPWSFLNIFCKSYMILRKDGKLYCYKSKSKQNEATEIIDIKSYTSMSRDKNTFTIKADEEEIENKVFKSTDKTSYNQWVIRISNVIMNSTKYLIKHAKKDGILNEDGEYIHKIDKQKINCPQLLEIGSSNPLDCMIYCQMKQKYTFVQEYYDHLNKYRHFHNEYEEKPICKYGDECKSYIRSEQGVDEDRIDDKCHMKLYRHPPRTRHIKLAENIKSWTMNHDWDQNHGLYTPNDKDIQKYHMHPNRYGIYINAQDEKDGWLEALMDEVIHNGYKYDLCMKCAKHDECKHDITDKQNEHSILQVVNEKMNHQRHILVGSPLTRDEMLGLVLYTGLDFLVHSQICKSLEILYAIYIGCDCNYDLCAAQRSGEYHKWKWFDYCLYWGIDKLSFKEKGEFKVYTGLSGVKLREKMSSGYFVTYVSTSWRKEVSKAFMKGNQGMLIEIDGKYKDHWGVLCSDVSWISKFPDECEVLFARSIMPITMHFLFGCDKMTCTIADESDGVQTVILKHQ